MSTKVLPIHMADIIFSDHAGAATFAPTTAIKGSITPPGDLPIEGEAIMAQDGGTAIMHAWVDGGISGGREFKLKFWGHDPVTASILHDLLRAFREPGTYFAGSGFAAWVDANNLPGAGKRALRVSFALLEQDDAPATYTYLVRFVVKDFEPVQEGKVYAYDVTCETIGNPTIT